MLSTVLMVSVVVMPMVRVRLVAVVSVPMSVMQMVRMPM
jgi:hypothetical protein